MSWETIKKKECIARKEHQCSSIDTFDGLSIVKMNPDKTWRLDEFEVETWAISKEDAQAVLNHANNGWKINPGDKYLYVAGTFDGIFMTLHWDLKILEIVSKYDLNEEN